jgi:hypothetical protein
MMGASLDITERREQESRLRNALEEIRRLQEQLRAGKCLCYARKSRLLKAMPGLLAKVQLIRRVLAQVEQVAPTAIFGVAAG